MRRIGTRGIAAVAIILLLGVAGAAPSGAAGAFGRVLPPQASPFGYSLADMAVETALFTQTGNDPAHYPHTPFQILYVDPSTVQAGELGGCLHVTGSNEFTTTAWTLYYVPIFNVTDVPPVLGEYPTTPAEARAHIFGGDQIGGQFHISVDGSSTPVGPEFVVGPLDAPLQSVGGSQVATVGVFLTPLLPGTHTVVIGGTLSGPLAEEGYGAECVSFEFTYTVHVVLPFPVIPFP